MRYLSIITLLITACQRNNPNVYIVTCRKQQSYVDIMGIANKFVMMYIDDSTQINFQRLKNPYTHNICLRCEDTLIRISSRLYKIIQKQPSIYNCGYKSIIEDCLKNPKDTIYTWVAEIYTTIELSDSIQKEASTIDLIVVDSIYNRVISSNAFALVTTNETTYCDCPVLGYLTLKPEPKHRIKELTVKHYRTSVNDGHKE